MTDEQLHIRMINKRIIAVAIFFFLISAGLFYYYFSTATELDTFNQKKSQEETLKTQVANLESENSSLRATIDQTGKELVSFSEDKIKYINLASKLSEENEVQINKLSVSDVWDEGQMAGMTTSIEVQGDLENVKNFINSYCGINNTNRINIVSCRPIGRFPWFTRGIDNKDVLTWLELDAEVSFWDEVQREDRRRLSNAMSEAGIAASDIDSSGNLSSVLEDLGMEEEEKEKPIDLEQMFAKKTFKVYLQIDFLGRQ